jgi:hypothetical protein
MAKKKEKDKKKEKRKKKQLFNVDICGYREKIEVSSILIFFILNGY